MRCQRAGVFQRLRSRHTQRARFRRRCAREARQCCACGSGMRCGIVVHVDDVDDDQTTIPPRASVQDCPQPQNRSPAVHSSLLSRLTPGPKVVRFATVRMTAEAFPFALRCSHSKDVPIAAPAPPTAARPELYLLTAEATPDGCPLMTPPGRSDQSTGGQAVWSVATTAPMSTTSSFSLTATRWCGVLRGTVQPWLRTGVESPADSQRGVVCVHHPAAG